MSDNAAGAFALIFTIVVVGGGVWWLWKWSGRPSTPLPKWACLRCGTVDDLAHYEKGGSGTELLLWLLGILPGLIYHLWRNSNSYYACSSCGSRELVPEDSPRAKQMTAAAR